MRTRRWLLTGLTALSLAGCGARGAAAVTSTADEYLAGLLDYRPAFGTRSGLPGADHGRVRDNSLDALKRWQGKEDGWLERLRKIDPASLEGRPEAVTYAVLREELEGSVASRVCRLELWDVASYVNGWQTEYSDLAMAQPVGTDDLRAKALARLRALPTFIDTEIQNLGQGLADGYSSPKVIVYAVLQQLDDILATPVERSPFASPAVRDSTPGFRTAYLEAIAKELNPAIHRYRDFLATKYLAAARNAIGVSAIPRGKECYQAEVRRFSTLELAPDSVYRLGMAEMERIEAEMREVAARSFGGATPAQVLERLRTDPQYLFKASDEIIAYAQAALDRARAAIPKAFGLTTSARVVIEPYPEFRARAGAPGQYNQGLEDGSRPGVFLINAYDPTHTSRANVESVTFHETYPGHHFQVAIARERKGLHPVARYLGSTGFIEGWGLYAEGVADELGLYSTDVDRMGWLASRAFRAARLVVDAGLHTGRLDRDSAVAYLRAHTTRPPAELEGEVNRYISWPGQATAYLLGDLEIQALRARAREALGQRFDLKAFHDRVLEDGAVPLPVLRAKIERWIAGGGGG